MITYKPIIIQGGRRKDGTWPVKIRVTFKGQSRRLPTTLVCTDNDVTRSGKIKNATILQKANELISRMRAVCADLSPFALDDWSVDDVVKYIRRGLNADTFKLDFFAFADNYITSKQGTTRKVYESALKAFENYLNARTCDINAITRKMLLGFVEWCPDNLRGKVNTVAASTYLAKLAHIYNEAKLQYNYEDEGAINIPRSPFAGIHIATPPSKGQRNVGVEVIQRIIDAKPERRHEQIALAAFMVSFCTMGANLADMWAAKNVGAQWTYNRQKTAKKRADHAEVRVTIPSEIQAFLDALQRETDVKGWWLPVLHEWSTEQVATQMINRALKRWAEREGIAPFTFYAARHSWASIARSLKIEKATIDEALAHVGDFRIADIYAERNWSLADDANRQVLALFIWK